MRTKSDPMRRFMSYVDKSEDGCWNWRVLSTGGYGRTKWFKGDVKYTELAHRAAYQLFIGPIPDGCCIDHLCRNRGCVNPAHLEAVSTRENLIRGVGLAAMNSRKTHCKNGHEFTKENTRYATRRSGRTFRVCRSCHRARSAQK